ncbi:MAG: DUF3046 domain-containing protein [Corynebacterium sp.]|nr:DUF3046 domain-containing protein [Corynebacterium sp.]
MRLADFHQRVTDIFGTDRGAWILHSHVLSGIGTTADEAMDAGISVDAVWERLCQDFEVPAEQYWGIDR